ncbi:MAG: protein kinase [bacterium]|nr:protein kinase [bacterium]
MARIHRKLGKYRIERRLAEGGFAAVYRARDTVSGIPVALKIPHAGLVNRALLDAFRQEVRLTARLDHPNILPVKDAGVIDGVFCVVMPLGQESLADRLTRRIGRRTLVAYAVQVLEAVAHAHGKRIMHCDIKPENFILFEDDRLRLADFGIAKVALRTLTASGSGTIGYVAPEQALGKPSLRSDVFAVGLVLYRMFSGCLPEWPFRWPPPSVDRLRRTLHPDLVKLLRRSLEVDSSKRFADANAMLRAFKRMGPRAIRRGPVRKRKRSPTAGTSWRTIRWREFLRQYRATLKTGETCTRCSGPMSEAMRACPWCGTPRRPQKEKTTFPRQCPRCKRGVKSDWRFCPWCYGKAINPESELRYTDARYSARCSNASCRGKLLMPFMSYCPWCRRKVQRKWRIAGAGGTCPRCAWSVLPDYWDHCPWCARRLAGHKR